MSEFNVACPTCAQAITVQDDYVGHEINCPSCQATLVVPPNPAAEITPSISMAGAPGQPPPPVPPKQARLSVSALGAPAAHSAPPAPAHNPAAVAPDQQGSAGYRAHMAKKPKKSYTGVIVSVAAVLLIGVSAYLNKGTISAKWKSMRGPTAAEIAATNKPAPPPELTASEIMAKTLELYKTMPNFSSKGQSTVAFDVASLPPATAGLIPPSVAADVTLKINRPNSFRIDESISLTLPNGVTTNITKIGWSTGNGYFYQSIRARTKIQSEEQLFRQFSSGVNVGVGDIIQLFMDDSTAGLGKADVEWSRNPDENVDGQLCYVLAGTVDTENVLVWISRDSFLINQTRVVMDGKSGMAVMDDTQIKAELKKELGKEPSLLEVATAKKMAKLTGSVTDTYGSIQTNANFTVADFTPDAVATPARGGQTQQRPPGSRAAQIVGGRRGR